MATKKLVLSLIGPPGSGKGSYGRHLAQALDCSLIGMSDVLRERRPDLDLSSGRLIDDDIVAQSLEEFLQHHIKDDGRGYLLDGFPRTIRQLEASSSHLIVDAAIQLAVPDFVCETKLMGRRLCKKCGGNFNINGVEQDGWHLPPTLPSASPDCSAEKCPWITRSDDQPGVVHSRLQTYHQHTDPIVEYFGKHGRLLKLKPYKGFDEVPAMIEKVQDFLKKKQSSDA